MLIQLQLQRHVLPAVSSRTKGQDRSHLMERRWKWQRRKKRWTGVEWVWFIPVALLLFSRPRSSLRFLRPRRLPFYLHSILATCFNKLHTTAGFSKRLCVYECVCVCTKCLSTYWLWFISTALSAIIIANLVKGRTPFFLNLRRAAAGVSPSGARQTHLRRCLCRQTATANSHSR